MEAPSVVGPLLPERVYRGFVTHVRQRILRTIRANAARQPNGRPVAAGAGTSPAPPISEVTGPKGVYEPLWFGALLARTAGTGWLTHASVYGLAAFGVC